MIDWGFDFGHFDDVSQNLDFHSGVLDLNFDVGLPTDQIGSVDFDYPDSTHHSLVVGFVKRIDDDQVDIDYADVAQVASFELTQQTFNFPCPF